MSHHPKFTAAQLRQAAEVLRTSIDEARALLSHSPGEALTKLEVLEEELRRRNRKRSGNTDARIREIESQLRSLQTVMPILESIYGKAELKSGTFPPIQSQHGGCQ